MKLISKVKRDQGVMSKAGKPVVFKKGDNDLSSQTLDSVKDDKIFQFFIEKGDFIIEGEVKEVPKETKAERKAREKLGREALEPKKIEEEVKNNVES